MSKETHSPVRKSLLTTMQEEQQEAVRLLHEAFPDLADDLLLGGAVKLRTKVYEMGRWPSVAEIQALFPAL